jgi:hypothetical protein
MLARRGVPCQAQRVRRNALGYHKNRAFLAGKLIWIDRENTRPLKTFNQFIISMLRTLFGRGTKAGLPALEPAE